MVALDQQVDKLKAAFGDQAFSGGDVARVLGIDPRGTGGIFKYMFGKYQVRKIRSGAYQFANVQKVEVTPVEAPAKVEIAPVTEQAQRIGALVRIGEFYLHERMLHIVYLGKHEGSDAIRLHTTIIEIDPATKHPRSKVITFNKSRDPKEYAQAVAWLDSMAGTPPHVVDDTALELAAELERKLNAAKAEIAELRSKLDAIRGAL